MMTPHRTAAPPEAPSLVYLLKQVELAVRSHLDEITAAHGLTSPQYTALSVLARNPGMTGARLARNAFVRVQSMAQTIAALQARGLITREVDPASRRQLRISLTPEGHDLVAAIQAPLVALEQEMLEGMSAAEAEAFAAALERIRHRLSGSHAH